MSNILEEALHVTQGPRRDAYGTCKENFDQTARIASAITGVELTAEQIVKIMFAVKLARLIRTPNHRDSVLDLAGYAWVYSQVMGMDDVEAA